MANLIETKLKIDSWDEQPYRELPDGGKFTRAEVALTGQPDGLAAARFEALLYYQPDGTSTYVTLMQVSGVLDGRAGGFVLRGQGRFDGTVARGGYEVVAGSGTGELAGITGTGESTSTHDDYPYMPLSLRYALA